MKLGKILRDNRRDKDIQVFTAEYFELTFQRYEETLTLVFMAPTIEKARIKAKSILHTNNGSKIVNIRKLDSKKLGPDITWRRSGSPYTRYTNKRKK